MNARLYDPRIGKFFSPDNVISSPENPQDYNRYSYAHNNPLIYTDPSGNFEVVSTLLLMYAIASTGYNTIKAIEAGGVKAGLITVGTSAASAAISYGVGYGISSALSGVSPGPLGSLLINAASGVLSGGLSSAVLGGKYTGEAALQSVGFSMLAWGAQCIESYIDLNMEMTAINSSDCSTIAEASLKMSQDPKHVIPEEGYTTIPEESYSPFGMKGSNDCGPAALYGELRTLLTELSYKDLKASFSMVQPNWDSPGQTALGSTMVGVANKYGFSSGECNSALGISQVISVYKKPVYSVMSYKQTILYKEHIGSIENGSDIIRSKSVTKYHWITLVGYKQSGNSFTFKYWESTNQVFEYIDSNQLQNLNTGSSKNIPGIFLNKQA